MLSLSSAIRGALLFHIIEESNHFIQFKYDQLVQGGQSYFNKVSLIRPTKILFEQGDEASLVGRDRRRNDDP